VDLILFPASNIIDTIPSLLREEQISPHKILEEILRHEQLKKYSKLTFELTLIYGLKGCDTDRNEII
jgi:hypothetical protein